MEKIIEIKDITKHYQMGDTIIRALNGVSFDIYRNEYVAIMGQSGSGKSTLMNIIGCLDTPTSGSYILNNNEVAQMTDNEQVENKNGQSAGRTHNFISQEMGREINTLGAKAYDAEIQKLVEQIVIKKHIFLKSLMK